MKAHTEYLTLNIPSKMAFRNITPAVREAVEKSGVQEGLVLVITMHITASVFINDDEPGLHHDFGKWLEPAFSGHRGACATLGTEGQIDVFEHGQRLGRIQLGPQRIGEQRALFERSRDRLAPLVERLELGQPVPNGRNRHLVQ